MAQTYQTTANTKKALTVQRGWGRFTARGGEQVEQQVNTLPESATEAGADALETYNCKAVVLIGGYGRSQGGVDRSDDQEIILTRHDE